MEQSFPQKLGPIGVLDSGYSGLTTPSKIWEALSDYDYIYPSDNARAPYGTRSSKVVYEFTLQAVNKLLEMDYHLVMLTCNIASAKALRTIQMNNLPDIDPSQRAPGVIRPTVECIDGITQTRHIGVPATTGTIKSKSYPLEIYKLFPDIKVNGEVCPMWVPLVENNEANGEGIDFFIHKYIHNLFAKDGRIGTIILGRTHYPLLLPKIQQFMPQNMGAVAQGRYVAAGLKDYLYRHPEMDRKYTRGSSCSFCTTEAKNKFIESTSIFLNQDTTVQRISLE